MNHSENKRKWKDIQIHGPWQRTNKLWNMKDAMVPIVVGTLGMVPRDLAKRLKESEIRESINAVYSYADACKQHNNKDKLYSSWKNIPLTLFERVVCERELETEQNCNILTPTLLAITTFLSRSPGLLNWGPGGPLCWVLAFSTTSCH